MKHYYITSNGSQHGPYPENQILDMIVSSQLQGTDLCRTEGMPQWAPLHSVIPLPPALPPPILTQDPQNNAAGSAPWFLYIPVRRLLFMSLITLGLFEVYWVYRNWKYLKERDGLDIRPFWRAIFSIFFIYKILKEIKHDKNLNSIGKAGFSPGGLATGWIILKFLGNILSRADDITVNLFGILLSAPSFLFLLPAQNFINRINEARPSKPNYSPWSVGHAVFLVIGVILVGLVLIGTLVPE
jgi:hypothetical protein